MENIKPIRTAEDLAWAISEVTAYFEKEPMAGSPDADRFDVLSDLVEAYENRTFVVSEQEPVVYLKSFMDLTGRTQSDLAHAIGSRSRASEIINRKRALTVDMIHRLHEAWGVPTDCLVKPYNLVAAE